MLAKEREKIHCFPEDIECTEKRICRRFFFLAYIDVDRGLRLAHSCLFTRFFVNVIEHGKERQIEIE
jgi:hypothetical protein